MRSPKPWTVYAVRYNPKSRPHSVQIRDAKGNILLVSASYGQHAGAPLDAKEMMAIARAVVRAVNSVSE